MNEPPNSRYFAANLQRPAHRVDHAVERLLDLPDLLHAELPLLRVLGADVEVADRGAGEMALACPRRARSPWRSGPSRARSSTSSSPSRPRPLSPERTPTTFPSSTSSLYAGGLAEDVDARLLGLLGEPAAELGDRGHVVAVVAERRRGRLQRDRPLAVRQDVDGVLVHGPVRRPVAPRAGPGTASASRTASSSPPTAGASPGPCPSRQGPPAPRRATPSAPRPPPAAA